MTSTYNYRKRDRVIFISQVKSLLIDTISSALRGHLVFPVAQYSYRNVSKSVTTQYNITISYV